MTDCSQQRGTPKMQRRYVIFDDLITVKSAPTGHCRWSTVVGDASKASHSN